MKTYKSHKLIMQWTHEAIMIYMDKNPDDQIYIIDKKETKAGRTRQQEKTYWKIFKWIGGKLWYKKEVVRTNLLTALFWTYEVKMFWEIHLIPNKTSTTELTKEDAIDLIDASLAYAKKIDAWIEIEWPEIQSLYNTYN